jgi:hypothetical protein
LTTAITVAEKTLLIDAVPEAGQLRQGWTTASTST